MTSTLGIVRLLQHFSNALGSRAYFIGFSLLYTFLTLLSFVSVNRIINTYRENRKLSIDGKLGLEIKMQAVEGTSFFDHILSERGGYMKTHVPYLSVIPIIYYVIMYILALQNFGACT